LPATIPYADRSPSNRAYRRLAGGTRFRRPTFHGKTRCSSFDELASTGSMQHFLKVLRLSLRYKWTVLTSVLTALMIGLLWGMSISTVYPVMEVVLRGETLETWLDEEIRHAEATIARLDRQIAARQQDLDGGAVRDVALRRSELSLKRSRRQEKQKSHDRLVRVRSWLRGRMPTTPIGTLVLVIVVLIGMTMLKGACLVANNVLITRVASGTAADMRRMFFRKVLAMDQAVIDRKGTGALMTQFSHSINFVTGGLRVFYGKSVREPLKMAACLIGAALVSWRLLLLSITVAPVGAFLVYYLAKRMRDSARGEIGGMSAAMQTLMEAFSGLKTVKIFNGERKERRRFKKNAMTLHRMAMRMAFFDSLTKPVTELTGTICVALAVLSGAYLVLGQETHLLGLRITDRPLTPSALFVFYAMLVGMSDPARKMGDIYPSLVRASMASRSFFEMAQKQPEVRTPDRPRPVPSRWDTIRFDHVWFSYSCRQWTLQDIHLEVPSGQTVALVGENGCGKTTLANLLVRFYDPQRGAIYLGDVDLREMNPRKLRRQISMVSQDALLFRGTIWENIAYGAPHADDEQIRNAGRLAGVEDFISQLPDGSQTDVGECGRALSGGQRQRVALARALAINPRILILDEPTSQIDRFSEQRLALRETLRGITTLLITHRLSTLEWADRVIVMDQGRIVADMPSAEYLEQTRAGRSIGTAAA